MSVGSKAVGWSRPKCIYDTVLAAGVGAYLAVLTSQLSDSLAVELEALTANLDRTVNAFREIRDENNRYVVTLDADIATDNTGLHDYRDSALKVLGNISDQLPQLKAETQSATAQVDFSAATAAQITRL